MQLMQEHFTANEYTRLRLVGVIVSPYDPQGCGKCRNEMDVFLPTHRDVGSALNCGEQFWPIYYALRVHIAACYTCALFVPCERVFTGE
jgi:hypothetical protein